MNNAYAMSASFEAEANKGRRTQAAMITGGFAVLMLLLMFLWKWSLPVFEKIAYDPGIEVELNLPEEPETLAGGGGGGGNPVQAAGAPGIANPSPPAPGEDADSKDIEEDNDKSTPAITKPDVAKPTATKITNTSVAKVPPKVVETPPAPPRPKAVMGQTTNGTGRGGGSTDDYERAGGRGTGSGVGNGSGTGGGNGSGNGGGNGSGNGGGNGPKVKSGDRKIVRYYSFQGDLEKAVVYANINVSPEGIGKFVSIAKGSSTSAAPYKDAIVRYLQNMQFNKADHESMITVQFNFRVN